MHGHLNVKKDTSSYLIRATCGWKACDVCPEAMPTLCSKSRISQCNWVCEGHTRDTEAHSFSCIDKTGGKKEKETLHNYEQPTAGTRVNLWNVSGM